MQIPRTFKTERLALRPPEASDAEAIYTRYATDPEVTRYLVWTPHQSIDDTHEFLEECAHGWEDASSLTWVVETGDEGVVGMVACRISGLRADLGYVLSREFWGQGLMTEAVQAVIEWLLREDEVWRVWAVCDLDNTASARLLEKVGMDEEGVLRSWLVHPNVSPYPRDVAAYSRVKIPPQPSATGRTRAVPRAGVPARKVPLPPPQPARSDGDGPGTPAPPMATDRPITRVTVNTMPDDATGHYLGRLANELRMVLEDDLVAAFATGSFGQRDFHPEHSDLDVLVVSARPLTDTESSHLAGRISNGELPCPAKGLDLVFYERSAVAAPPRAPRASGGFVTGATWDTEVTGEESDESFLLDLAICRRWGRPLVGGEAKRYIGSIPEAWLRPVVEAVIGWHRPKIHDPFHDPMGECAVLNAARAWRYLETGVLGSKTAGGQWALLQSDVPVVHAALAVRHGERTSPLEAADVLEFLDLAERSVPS